MTEEIINALAAIPQLKVTSRTSSFFFKNHKGSLQDIGEQLQVNTILEGSVRRAGDQVRITAQLIDVDSDSHFWSETWDRKLENIFQIQDEISLHIAEKLRETYGHLEISEHLVHEPTHSLSAYEHYLKGKHHFYQWNPTSANRAIEEFEQAVSLDPEMIDGHIGLADSYSFLAVAGFAPREAAWAKAMAAIQAAKKIDPSHAGLNYMLGNQAFFTEANYAAAMDFGLRSVASKPTYPEAHRFLSFLYTLQGDLKKSADHIHYAKSIDPLNQETLFFEANHLYRSRQYDLAEEILKDLLIQNPNNLPALAVNSYIQILKGAYDAAKAMITAIPDPLLAPDEKLGLLGLVAVFEGNTHPPQLPALAAKLEDPIAHHAHSYLFLLYANLGQNEAAFEVLKNLFRFNSSVLLLGFSDPLSAKIHSDPRYTAYHEKIYAVKNQTTRPKKTQSTMMETEKAQAFESRLLAHLEAEQPYLSPTLTLRELADQIEMHPNQLSWLLNEYLGKNFNELINQCRIDHFKMLVVDPGNHHISLIGLAYESGFNSKTVFNTTFKKMVGMTPKEYQKSHS